MNTKRTIRMMIKKISKAFLIWVFTLSVMAGCLSEPEQAENDIPELKVKGITATMTEKKKQHHFSGSVEGRQRINLSTKIMGRIEVLNVDEGDRIRRGEILLRIKSDGIESQLRQVKANLNEARTNLKNTGINYKRISALYQDSSATKKELDDIATAYESAKSRVNALESRQSEVEELLDYATIQSPIDGFVVDKRISKGDLASPGQPLLIVEDTANLEVNISVPESQIDLFSVGDTVEVKVDASDEQFEANVQRVNPSSDPLSRQFEVTISIPETIGQRKTTKPGMYARVTLHKGMASYLTIPESALLRKGQLTGIFTVNRSNELVLRWIRIGGYIDGEVEVLSGLTEGETYITTVDGRLKEGTRVTFDQ